MVQGKTKDDPVLAKVHDIRMQRMNSCTQSRFLDFFDSQKQLSIYIKACMNAAHATANQTQQCWLWDLI